MIQLAAVANAGSQWRGNLADPSSQHGIGLSPRVRGTNTLPWPMVTRVYPRVCGGTSKNTFDRHPCGIALQSEQVYPRVCGGTSCG